MSLPDAEIITPLRLAANSRECKEPLLTRVQEIDSDEAGLRVFVIDSLERRLKEAGVGLSARDALPAVQTLRYVRFQVGDQVRTGTTVGSAQARQVLRALGIDDLRPPTSPKGQETVV